MYSNELKVVLDKHLLWQRMDPNGERANLAEANLIGANLAEANLIGANLIGANLRRADLREADLRGANLIGANLAEANLIGANLRRAILRRADLREADLRGARLPHFQIPQGSIIGWKKSVQGGIVKLRIPPNAKRTASLVGRKCRAEFAEVVEVEGGEYGEAVKSIYDCDFSYKVGEFVHPDSYDEDIRVECTNGIHFFLTREEAEEY